MTPEKKAHFELSLEFYRKLTEKKKKPTTTCHDTLVLFLDFRTDSPGSVRNGFFSNGNDVGTQTYNCLTIYDHKEKS